MRTGVRLQPVGHNGSWESADRPNIPYIMTDRRLADGVHSMTVIAALLSVVLILGVLIEAFETMLLPRRVARSFRLTRLFYINTWRLWTLLAGPIRPARRRSTFLSSFGPLSLLLLLSLWALGLIMGFALLQWSA